MPSINIADYLSSRPFPHTVIDGPLVSPDLWRAASRLLAEKAPLDSSPLKSFANQFRTSDFLELVRFLSKIDDMELDPEAPGAYEEHWPCGDHVPRRDLRPDRLGAVAFLNSDWKDDRGGSFEIWSDRNGEYHWPTKLIRPLLNRIVLYDPRGWVRTAPVAGGHDDPASEQYVRRFEFRAFYRSRSRYRIPADRAEPSAFVA